jgi:PBP1b-binding outer membrane lipoprotein LpoB
MKLIFLIAFLLTGCSENSLPPSNLNSSEATLQSAEDANTKEFTEDSFK